jgi:hypothetical protein
MNKNEHNIKIFRTGTLKIVSSGGTDRYITDDIHLVIVCNGISYSIYNKDQYAAAYLWISEGLTPGEDYLNPVGKWKKTLDIVSQSSVATYAYYARNLWNHWRHEKVKTTHDRLQAGIYKATGYPNLLEDEIEKVKKIADTLTELEWLIIKTGLEEINENHKKHQKPVVPFTIPELPGGESGITN